MNNINDQKNEILISLIDPGLKFRQRIRKLDEIQIICGYELVFILSAVMRYKFSGNLIVVNDNNELSGITFIYGDIVKIDYPDRENMLGNLLVDEGVLSKIELQKITEEISGKKIGLYLLEKQILDERQLKLILFKQSKLRLAKYIETDKIRVNFNFDGESEESSIVDNSNYYEIMYDWIFNFYKPEWLSKYLELYSHAELQVNVSYEDQGRLKDFDYVSISLGKLKDSAKETLSYNELVSALNFSGDISVRVVHFLVLCGFLVILNKFSAEKSLTKSKSVKSDNISINLENAKQLILNRKYFEAFGIINKYSSLIPTEQKIRFYFIWIKLHSSFYNDFLLDLKKIDEEISEIDAHTVGLGEFYYVKALLAANRSDESEYLINYKKAIACDGSFSRYPIAENSKSIGKTILGRFMRKIGF